MKNGSIKNGHSVLSVIRQMVESNSDYQLRRALINKLRMFLDVLEVEAESIKHIELPLWFLDKNSRLLLIREDVDSENLAWAKSCCREDLASDFCREETGVKNGGHVFRHDGPYIMISIGNKATPVKRYFMGRLNYEYDSVRGGLSQRLGEATWSYRPQDMNSDGVLRLHFR